MKKIFILIDLLVLLSNSFGQVSKKLDSLLLTDLSIDSNTEVRWGYFPDRGYLQKIEKSEVNKFIPNFTFYEVVLTYSLGYHIGELNCLILFDSINSKVLLSPPIEFSDINEAFLKLFIGAKFENVNLLKSFLYELQDLMKIGSLYLFDNTVYNIDKVTFDFTQNVNGKRYVWRNFEVAISNNSIQSFKWINPKTKESVLVK